MEHARTIRTKNQTQITNLVWKFTGPWDQITCNFWQCFAQTFFLQYLQNLKSLEKITLDLPLPLSVICNLLNLAQVQLTKLKIKALDFETNQQNDDFLSNLPELQTIGLFFDRQNETLKEFILTYKMCFSNSLFHLRNALAYLTKVGKICLKLELANQEQVSNTLAESLDTKFLCNFPALTGLRTLRVYIRTQSKDNQFTPRQRFQFLQCISQMKTLRRLTVRGISKDLYEKYPYEMEMLKFLKFKHLSSLVLDDRDAPKEIQNKAELYSIRLLCLHEFA